MGGLKWKPWISAENDESIYAQPLNTKDVLVVMEVMEVMEQSDSCGLRPSVSSPHQILEIKLLNVVVNDTQSDSIPYLNFAKNDSFNIRFNIALPKIQFKILFNSK